MPLPPDPRLRLPEFTLPGLRLLREPPTFESSAGSLALWNLFCLKKVPVLEPENGLAIVSF